ncbi:MAG: hypothetical protein AB8B91_06225 [Rubripirellula sp.]
MNINPSAAASVAGTARAAAKGGEADNKASEATRQQATSEAPGGKASDSSALDAGDQTSDRDGNGRQVLDVFERSEETEAAEEESETQKQPPAATDDGTGGHLDLEA